MSEHAEFRRPSYSKYHNELFKTKWSEILSPNGVRPTVELDGPDELPASAVLRSGTAETGGTAEQAAVMEVRASAPVSSSGTELGVVYSAGLGFVNHNWYADNDAVAVSDTAGNIRLEIDGTTVTTFTVAAFRSLAASTAGTSRGSSYIAPATDSSGRTWYIGRSSDYKVLVSADNAQGGQTVVLRHVNAPRAFLTFPATLPQRSAAGALAEDGAVVDLRGTIGNNFATDLDVDASEAQDVADATGRQAKVRVGDGTQDDSRVDLFLPLSYDFGGGNVANFEGTGGNGWKVTLVKNQYTTDVGILSFRNRRFQVRVATSNTTPTIAEMRDAWISQFGAGTAVLTGTGAHPNTVINVSYMTPNEQTFAGGVNSGKATAVVTAADPGGDRTLTLNLPNEAQYNKLAGNDWRVRVTTGGTGDHIDRDAANKRFNIRLQTNEIANVKTVWDGHGTGFTSDYGGTGANSLAVTSLFTAASGGSAAVQASATLNGTGTGNTATLTLPSVGSYHGVDLRGVDGNSVDVRLLFNQTLDDGENHRVRLKEDSGTNYIEVLFSGPFATLQELHDAWEAPRQLDPDPTATASDTDGIGRGGMGGTAVIAGTASTLLQFGQSKSFANGADAQTGIPAAGEISFSGGTGVLAKSAFYQLTSSALNLYLKGDTVGELVDFWERSQATGGIGGEARLEGNREDTFADQNPVFRGGSNPTLYRAAVPGTPATEELRSAKGNSVPDSKLRLVFKGRTNREYDMTVETVDKVRKRVAMQVGEETHASTLIEPDGASTGDGIRLTVPCSWNDSDRVRIVNGTYNGCGDYGNEYDITLYFADEGNFGGVSRMVVDATAHTITASLEKDGSTNPSVGELRALWEHAGGTVELEGSTDADDLLQPVSNQDFAGGMHPDIDLGENPTAVTMVREPNRWDKVTTYARVSSRSGIDPGERSFYLDGSQLEFDRSWQDRTLIVEYEMANTHVELKYVGRDHFVLTAGSGATWENVATALNADAEFSRLFEAVLAEPGADLLLPSSNAGNHGDKPVPGVYGFQNGSLASAQRAVVSTGGHDVSLVVGEPPRTERFMPTSGSKQTKTLAAAPTDGTISLSQPGQAFQPEPESAERDVTENGEWHVAGTTLTYWTSNDTNAVTVKYAVGVDEASADIAEADSEEEIIVDPGKSLYAKTSHSAAEGGSIEAYDDRTDYRWVEGFRGIPREAA